jgi:DNA-binding XRE family transcriptional regulator
MDFKRRDRLLAITTNPLRVSAKGSVLYVSTLLEKDLGPLTFGMYLRSMRTTLDLSQTAMAKKLGMSRGTLCDIEKGRQQVSLSLAKKIAHNAGFSETLAIKAAIQDQLTKAKVKLRFELTG